MRSGKKLYRYANIGHIEPPTDGNWSSRLPFFVRNKSTIQKSLSPFDFLFRIHSTQQRTPNPLPRPVFRPLLQSPPTGGGRTILPGHVRPSTTGFQDVENSVQGFSRICGRTSGSRFGFGKKGFNHSPLFVCQLMSRTHASIFHFTLADHVFEIACKQSNNHHYHLKISKQ